MPPNRPGAGHGPDETHGFEHLAVKTNGLCWWCLERPATTGEHKYKRTDLARLMDDDSLVWFGDNSTREIRGRSGVNRDRYGVVKFPKSMCAECNNVRSQPFDRAYDRFATFLAERQGRLLGKVPLSDIYGDTWREDNRSLARYYAKHFGCRLQQLNMPIPNSLRAFLDGSDSMPDVHLALITTDTIHRYAQNGLVLSPDMIRTDAAREQLHGFVMASYFGAVGVRFQSWTPMGGPPDEL